MDALHYAFQELAIIRKETAIVRLYALVDGIQYDRFFDGPLKEEKAVRSLFSLPEDRALAFAGPWLMDITELPQEYYSEISQLEKNYPAVSWIITEQPFLPLVKHLGSCMMISLPSKQTGIFRFYDCRVLKILPELLSMEQIDLLMKYTLRWLFLSDEDEIICYQHDDGIVSRRVLGSNARNREILS